MRYFTGIVVCALLGAVACQSPVPNPIYEAKPLLKLVNSTSNGKLFDVATDDVRLKVLHVFGSAQDMGRAQGELLGSFAYDFLTKAIPEFYRDEVSQIPLGSLPAWLQKLIIGAGKAAAPTVFGAALDYVLAREKKYVAASRPAPLDEMSGLAAGLCSSGQVAGCNAKALEKKIQQLNMLPELIKMTCSMLGAWGTATPDGKLTQLRALDFGSGPFANYTVLTVYHPSQGGHAFASLGFPGFVGAVTGWSAQVGLSEKVWETYDKKSVQPGHYDGQPVVGFIRDVLQFADTKEDAIEMALHPIAGGKRTWAVFLGVGDAASQEFRAMGYREADLQVLGPENVTNVTGFAAQDDVVFIDKHPQPSHDATTMPDLVSKWHGNLTARNVAQYFPRLMQSSDLHATVYDYGANKAYVAIGTIDGDGQYIEMACDRPFLEFDFDDLFNEPAP